MSNLLSRRNFLTATASAVGGLGGWGTSRMMITGPVKDRAANAQASIKPTKKLIEIGRADLEEFSQDLDAVVKQQRQLESNARAGQSGASDLPEYLEADARRHDLARAMANTQQSLDNQTARLAAERNAIVRARPSVTRTTDGLATLGGAALFGAPTYFICSELLRDKLSKAVDLADKYDLLVSMSGYSYLDVLVDMPGAEAVKLSLPKTFFATEDGRACFLLDDEEISADASLKLDQDALDMLEPMLELYRKFDAYPQTLLDNWYQNWHGRELLPHESRKLLASLDKLNLTDLKDLRFRLNTSEPASAIL